MSYVYLNNAQARALIALVLVVVIPKTINKCEDAAYYVALLSKAWKVCKLEAKLAMIKRLL